MNPKMYVDKAGPRELAKPVAEDEGRRRQRCWR